MTSRRLILHESTQRSLTQLSFLLLGVAPLVLCLYLSLATFVPGYERRQAAKWERQLSDRFGLPFRIAAVHEVAPFRYRLEGVQVLTPESLKPVASIQSIDIAVTSGKRCKFQLDQPVLELDQLAQAARIFSQWYLTRASSESSAADIDTERLLIRDREQQLQLADLSIRIIPGNKKWGVSSTFKLKPSIEFAGSVPQDSQLLVERDSSTELVSTRLQLTANTPVPSSMLLKLFGNLAGSVHHQVPASAIQESQFRGVFQTKYLPTSTTYFLTNAIIDHLDLGQLTAGSDGVASGMATLRIDQAKFSESQLYWAQGGLFSGSGRIDANFLKSMAYYLGVSLGRNPELGQVGFDRLAFEFTMMPQYLQLWGAGQQPGAILEDAYGTLAWRQDTSKLPIVSLVHALAFRADNASLTSRITPLVRTALVWLPMEDQERREAELVISR